MGCSEHFYVTMLSIHRENYAKFDENVLVPFKVIVKKTFVLLFFRIRGIEVLQYDFVRFLLPSFF